jgi:hypothetical protein
MFTTTDITSISTIDFPTITTPTTDTIIATVPGVTYPAIDNNEYTASDATTFKNTAA